MIIDLIVTSVTLQPELNAVQLIITPTFTSGTGGGGQDNVIETVSINGTNIPPVAKNIPILLKSINGVAVEGSGDIEFLTSAISETPIGLVNGINTSFELSETPISKASLFVTVDGILRSEEIVSLVGKVFTLNFAPETGSPINVQYFTSINTINLKISDIEGLQTELTKLTSIIVSTYAAMIATPTPTIKTDVLVLADEKNNSGNSSEYTLYPSGLIMWKASININQI